MPAYAAAEESTTLSAARKPVGQTRLGYLQTLVRVSKVVSEGVYGFDGFDAPSAPPHQLRKQTGIERDSSLLRSN